MLIRSWGQGKGDEGLGFGRDVTEIPIPAIFLVAGQGGKGLV